MDQIHIDYTAVVIAAVLYLAIGFVWYSKYLFGPAWAKMSGMKMGGGKGTFLASCVIAFVSAYFLAYLQAYLGVTTVSDGMYAAFCIWLGFIATTQVAGVVWGKQPFRLFLIHTGFKLLSFLVMGGILGA